MPRSLFIALNVINPSPRDWYTEWISIPMEKPVTYYLLFGGWNHTEGGADDFEALFVNEKEARDFGLERWGKEDSVRLASWMQLAKFNPNLTPALRVIANLHIPGAENCATQDDVEEGMEDTLHWIDEGVDDPVYSAESK